MKMSTVHSARCSLRSEGEILLRLPAAAMPAMNKSTTRMGRRPNPASRELARRSLRFAPAPMFVRVDFLRFGVKRAISSQVLGITAQRRFLGGGAISSLSAHSPCGGTNDAMVPTLGPSRAFRKTPANMNTTLIPSGPPCVEGVVRELIDRCYGSLSFSLKVVCANLHLSQSRMAQKFKSCYGKTILEYWSEVRLNRACTLLSERPARSIGSIAAELGYQHSNNFTNWFTRQMGMPPRQYIANVQSGAPSCPFEPLPGDKKLKNS